MAENDIEMTQEIEKLIEYCKNNGAEKEAVIIKLEEIRRIPSKKRAKPRPQKKEDEQYGAIIRDIIPTVIGLVIFAIVFAIAMRIVMHYMNIPC